MRKHSCYVAPLRALHMVTSEVSSASRFVCEALRKLDSYGAPRQGEGRSAARENMIEMLFAQKETLGKERDQLQSNVDVLSRMAAAQQDKVCRIPCLSSTARSNINTQALFVKRFFLAPWQVASA